MEIENTKYYHLIDGLEESYIYKKDNRKLIFKNDIIYLYKYFKEYGWFEVATTIDNQLALYWLETGELSKIGNYPHWVASYEERKPTK